MTDSVANPVAEMWQTAGDIGNVVVAATAVYLLGQGLADRRRSRADAQRVQASRIHLSVQEHYVDTGGGGYGRISRSVRLRNDSELPVTLSGWVTLHRSQHWEAYVAGTERPSTTTDNAKPIHLADSMLRPGEEVELHDEQLGWDYAVLRFTDATGIRWVRVSQTGALFREQGPPSARSLAFQFLAQLPVLKWILSDLPNKYLLWRFKRKEGVPLFARIYRWLWGYMPIGEPEPWEMPQGGKRQDWPYEYMLALGRFERAAKRKAAPKGA